MSQSKSEQYADVRKQIAAVIAGESSRTARYATASCLLREMFGDRYFWTGFYLVAEDKPRELVVGPYQGTMGCLRIPFGKGVCGAAAASGETQLVEDVHAFPGHIACSSSTRSELVIPVRNAIGAVIGVLDIDSDFPDAFDQNDADALTAILTTVFGQADLKG